MSQSWHKLRTYLPLWLGRLLRRAVAPFEAQTLERYGTNGYLLLGLVLLHVIVMLRMLGFASGPVSQLPAWLRDTLGLLLGFVGVKNIPTTLPLIVLIGVFYLAIFFVAKPVRVAVGEKFADLVFWCANVGINLGEWCIEHRWVSLLFVVVLAGSMSWGVSYVADAQSNKNKLKADFEHWLDQMDKFSDRSTASYHESHGYAQVSTFWDDNYATVVKLPDGREHPAFALHRMFDELYMNQKARGPWREMLRTSLPNLLKHYEYRPTPARMTDNTEKRAWALMNILMGRIYVRLGRECGECTELAEAKKYFDNIGTQYRSLDDRHYQVAAQNGLGTLYANALTALLQNPKNPPRAVQSVCPTAAECARLAFDEYARVEGDRCSFEGLRAENNTIDLLLRIGLNADRMSFADVKLDKVCGSYVNNGPGLADCIGRRLKDLVACSSHDQFVPLSFVTAAQAYGVSVELRRKTDPAADVAREVTAAGSYLHLAYALNKNADDNIKTWGLCYFRFAKADKQLADEFLKAVAFGPEHLPAPNPQYLLDIIGRDTDRCQ